MNFKIENIPLQYSSLKVMLAQLTSTVDIAVDNFEDSMKAKETLAKWIVDKIAIQVKTLNAAAVSCVVTKDILTSIACELLKLLDDKMNVRIKPTSSVFTQALTAYCHILDYLLKRYANGCNEDLQTIYTVYTSVFDANKEVIFKSQFPTNVSQKVTNSEPFTFVLFKHTKQYLMMLLPAFLNNFELLSDDDKKNRGHNLHNQINVILKLCKEMISRMHSKTARVNLLKECLIPMVVDYKVPKSIYKDLWKFTLYFISNSAFDSQSYQDFLLHLISDITVFDSKFERAYDRDINKGEFFKPINLDNYAQIAIMLMESLTSMFRSVKSGIIIRGELGGKTTDNYMFKVCSTAQMLVEFTHRLYGFGLHSSIELEAKTYASLATEMFDTLTLILKQYSKVDHINVSMGQWESITVFNEILVSCLKPFCKKICGHMGSMGDIPKVERKEGKDRISEDMTTEKVLAALKKNEKIYLNFEKSFQRFHTELVMTKNKKKYGPDNNIQVEKLGYNQKFRDFKTDREIIDRYAMNEVFLAPRPAPNVEEMEQDESDPVRADDERDFGGTYLIENRDESPHSIGDIRPNDEDQEEDAIRSQGSYDRLSLEDNERTSPELDEYEDNAYEPRRKRSAFSFD